MANASNSVTFRVRPRLSAPTAIRIGAIVAVTALITSWLAGDLSTSPLRTVAILIGTTLVVGAVAWLWIPIFSRRATVTVVPSGFSVAGHDGAGGFCPWAKILDAQFRTSARNETVIWVHTGFGLGVELPLECAQDSKFLSLVQIYGTSSNPLAVFLRSQLSA